VDAMVRALAAGGAPRGAASGPPSTCAAA
jgi:hypothetical protein